MAHLTVIVGGVRSGKSAYAQRSARQLEGKRLFVATAEAFDDEMRARIAAHQDERAGEFETYECPLQLSKSVDAARSKQLIVLDCMTLWLSRVVLAEWQDDAIDAELEHFLTSLRAHSGQWWIVSNEVGMGIVPDNALARRFRDLSGRVNQRIAAASDTFMSAQMGIVLRIWPGPVEAVHPFAHRHH